MVTRSDKSRLTPFQTGWNRIGNTVMQSHIELSRWGDYYDWDFCNIMNLNLEPTHG